MIRTVPVDRNTLVRRGLWLNYATIGFCCLEAVVSLTAGFAAGSVALVGFGADSLIEVISGGAAQWRLRSDFDPTRRDRAERLTARIIGWSFLALGAYVLADSGQSLWLRERPATSVAGILMLIASVIVMPILARAKRRVAHGMTSGALKADAAQSSLCAYLSAIALAGVVLNAILGWWWADPIAALAMVPIIAKEGIEGARGEAQCDDCC